MSLRRAAAAAARHSDRALCLWAPGSARASLHTSCTNLLAEVQPSSQEQQHHGQPPPPPPAAAAATRPPAAPRPSSSSSTAVVVQRESQSLVQRTVSAALEAVNRLVMLLGSIHHRHTSANEAYVQRYLERQMSMDSFTLQYLHVMRPAIFRLSVSRDIEPVVAWLRSLGIRGGELTDLVRHTPAVLSASVDEQLEPLADLIRWAGGSPHDVLLAFPGIAAVPVAHLQGTRHVLRQLGVTEEDFALLLISLPDLASQLAETMHRLFQDFGVAAWKLKARQRRQLAGMVHHHMMHWNRHGRPAAASAAAARGYDSDNEGEGGPRAGPHPHRAHLRSAGGTSHRHPSQGHLLSTSLLMDREVFRRLKRMQAALEALSMQEELPEDWEVAVGELAHSIDALGELSKAAEEGRR